MKVIVPGHVYHCEIYDLPKDGMSPVIWIGFMRRTGPGYPGNADTSAGTNCQEVVRVLIDRVEYLNKQQAAYENTAILYLLRSVLFLFESRAKRVKGKKLPADIDALRIETYPTCPKCGHIYCEEQHAK